MGKHALFLIFLSISVAAEASNPAGNEDAYSASTPDKKIFNANRGDLQRPLGDYNPKSFSHEDQQFQHDLKEYLQEQDDIEQKLKLSYYPMQRAHAGLTPLVKSSLPSDGIHSVGSKGQNSGKSSRQFPCPEAHEIVPCECSYDESDFLYMNCTNVESEDQLASVFQAEILDKTYKSFYMGRNDGIKFFGDIFNGVTFEEVEVVRATNLELVSQYWLYESRTTLKYLAITHSKLHSETFPFISMDAYTKLETLFITYANLTKIPPLYSQTLTEVAFEASNIAEVSPATFQNVNGLTYINLGDNNISVIEANTFRLNNAQSTVYLYQNNIHTIEPGAFVLPDNPEHLSLFLHVAVNHLTTLDEEVFGPVFEYVTNFEVYGNPLECGCDLAWLITNPAYMAKVGTWAQCDDGTNLFDLDPKPFEDLCYGPPEMHPSAELLQ